MNFRLENSISFDLYYKDVNVFLQPFDDKFMYPCNQSVLYSTSSFFQKLLATCKPTYKILLTFIGLEKNQKIVLPLHIPQRVLILFLDFVHHHEMITTPEDLLILMDLFHNEFYSAQYLSILRQQFSKQVAINPFAFSHLLGSSSFHQELMKECNESINKLYNSYLL